MVDVKKANPKSKDVIKYADFCCGLGAYHIAFDAVSRETGVEHKCVFACDIHPGVRDIYEKNHGLCPAGDLLKLDPSALPNFDIMCAGFPCQPFSIAGSKQGVEDPRGQIFPALMRIAAVKKPSCLLFENVPNLLSIEKGAVFQNMVDAMEHEGFNVYWKILTASDYGSPQMRKRMYIVALAKRRGKSRMAMSRSFKYQFPEPHPGDPPTVASIMDLSVDERHVLDKNFYLRPTSGKHLVKYHVMNSTTGRGGGQGQRIYHSDRPGPTFLACNIPLFFDLPDGSGIRLLTVRETLRMFGFPDTFICAPKRVRMMCYLGNSIVVNVLEDIIKMLPHLRQ